MEITSEVKVFGGRQIQFKHASDVVNCEMTASVFLPPNTGSEPIPVVYWLSGLTCNDQNFVTKAGAQQTAAALGLAIVCPDTSPRGETVPDDDQQAWDFGLGAGFYVNATEQPWSTHYQMFDYVTQELTQLVESNFNIDAERKSIAGHSMGGHGALVAAFKAPKAYRSVSAFSPIVSPINCPWGQKAFSQYLGRSKADWQEYDACALVRVADQLPPTLVDQGTADGFLEEQLKTELLAKAAIETNHSIEIRYQEGYDHSYFFIATFIAEHLAFHAQHL